MLIETKLKSGMRPLARGLKEASFQALKPAAAQATRDVKKTLRGGKRSGRTYTVHVKGGKKKHTASAPGEPPASLTGALAKSIRRETKRNRDGATANIFPTVPQGQLELGIPSQGIAPRPYLLPTFQRNWNNWLAIFTVAFRAEMAKLILTHEVR